MKQEGFGKMNACQDVHDVLMKKFQEKFGRAPDVVAYAPGRVEILGNHTDYNEGYVLSAAINFGTYFAVARREGLASPPNVNVMARVAFRRANPQPSKDRMRTEPRQKALRSNVIRNTQRFRRHVPLATLPEGSGFPAPPPSGLPPGSRSPTSTV